MKPEDFKLSDISSQTKQYCLDNFGYDDLAEYFYPEFMENWRYRLTCKKSAWPKWSDPDLALKR